MGVRVEQKKSIFSDDEWERIKEAMRLSPRQLDVVKCLFRGFGDKQIANHLGIAVSTVRAYMSKLFLKLSAADRVEVILCVLSRFLDQSRCGRGPRVQDRRS